MDWGYRPSVGRLAPSPTGGLHVGHARTFLIAWLMARMMNGRVILRIEDIDASRVKPGAIQAIIADLLWLGFDWEEGPDIGGPHAPYLQSERMATYEEALDQLKGLEAVYPCTCTRADIARAASAPHAGEEGPRYPGTCAGRTVSDAATLGDRPYTWRFRTPDHDVEWFDFFQEGATRDHGGDFIVGRSSGEPSYQLAVVSDDAAMGVTQVIRGDDLIPSTPRQILLYRTLGWRPPFFAHVPLVLGPDGKRLAKRDGSIKLASLRDLGVDPRVLIGCLAGSIGQPREQCTPRDLIEDFSWRRIPMQPWTMPPVETLLARQANPIHPA